jgi:hypothetical protein
LAKNSTKQDARRGRQLHEKYWKLLVKESSEKALESPDPFKELRHLAIQLLSTGQDQAGVLAVFEKARQELRQANRGEDEDVIMEVMDCLVGWCSPSLKLPPDPQAEVVKDG